MKHPAASTKLVMTTSTLLLAVMTLFSCHKADRSPDIAAAVGTQTLTDAEIRRAIPTGLTPDDSMLRVNAFIDQWIADKVITEIALQNIHDTSDIDRLTEDYRRNLIKWRYRQLMAENDTSLQISDNDINAFYQANKGHYRTTETLLKGIYIAIPLNSPHIPSLRKLLNSTNPSDIDKLEKIASSHSADYLYFLNKWQGAAAISARFPTLDPNPKANHTYENSDNAYLYLLHLDQVLPTGSQTPLELASPTIRQLLERQRSSTIDAILCRQLLDQAKERGQIYIRQMHNQSGKVQ